MDKLDYELSGTQREKREQVYIAEQTNTPPQNQDEALSFSVGAIEALEKKVKDHNSNYDRKVTLYQLKQVFCAALDEPLVFDDISNTTLAFARVNMYLRMVSGNVGKLNDILKSGHRIAYSKFIEISANWAPSKEDLQGAASLVESHNLHYKFSSTEELYLNYQPINHIRD